MEKSILFREKKLTLTKQKQLKNREKLTMDSDSPTPITFDQTLPGKPTFGRTDGRTEYERTCFATQRMTLLSIEGTILTSSYKAK